MCCDYEPVVHFGFMKVVNTRWLFLLVLQIRYACVRVAFYDGIQQHISVFAVCVQLPFNLYCL